MKGLVFVLGLMFSLVFNCASAFGDYYILSDDTIIDRSISGGCRYEFAKPMDELWKEGSAQIIESVALRNYQEGKIAWIKNPYSHPQCVEAHTLWKVGALTYARLVFTDDKIHLIGENSADANLKSWFPGGVGITGPDNLTNYSEEKTLLKITSFSKEVSK
jgi:hypothetical protein